MKTDIPLKRLTALCATDLLTLIGSTATEVVSVETLEIPSSRTSLDTVLWLRGADGQPYMHLIEWQGWRDPLILWRTMGYLAWTGQNHTERPILVTLIYLTPEDDMGDTLVQTRDGQTGWQITIPCVRLWQQDAAAAVASGKPGLAALSPLMQGASEELVEQAAQIILHQLDPAAQGELLSALGIFAEPLMTAERFVRLITKERLMSTDLISYLMQDKIAEWAQERTELTAQIQAAQEAAMKEAAMKEAAMKEAAAAALKMAHQAIEDILIARFPEMPVIVLHTIRQITDPARLQALFKPLATAATLDEARQLLTAAAAEG